MSSNKTISLHTKVLISILLVLISLLVFITTLVTRLSTDNIGKIPEKTVTVTITETECTWIITGTVYIWWPQYPTTETVNRVIPSNPIAIVDLLACRRNNPDGTFDIEISIAIKNIINQMVRIDEIIIPTANWTSGKLNVVILPERIWSASFLVLDDKPRIEIINNIIYPWGEIWRVGTEHLIIVRFYILGDPQLREVPSSFVVAPC